ncbi:phosphotransferase family protein [Arthroderma uncinatum]|uniref:phosphotransferase family protein n=1 Tax=Arthroderma uncinatum TaxID=74035 RepID=UPI00144A8228|nr:phosphotransferase family protein [Arthroderma uncinatum]KAF3482912.1 phosphotransferase family protein [Arthroderma uncinatum]
MEFIAKTTTIPVPKVFETRYVQRERDTQFCIVVEYIPGKPLNIIWKDLSEEQKTNICYQIDGYLSQLRKLTGDRIMAADGGSLNVGLYQRRWLGPYDTVKEFHHSLAKGEPHNLGDNHAIHFAHADLAPRNIIVDENTGRINAIIDWERAGWYPEYWDIVRMNYDRPSKREMGGYTKHWKSVFNHIYEEEFSAMVDLIERTIVPYPDGNVNEPRPDILTSSATHAEQLRKTFETNLE